MNTKQADQTYVAHTYARFPVEIVSGRGSEVFDETGKRYIDLTSGIGVDAFGVADPAWIAAVTAQLGRVQHISNLFYTAPAANLAQLLCERTGMKRVFFSNSGAEANECAIKAARKYAAQTKGADTYTILTLEKSFHGRTLATLSATGQDKYHAQFQPLLPGFVHTPANDLDALKAAAETHKLAAVMMECVQGEGGVTALDPAFVQGAAAFCKANDILLIIDEVQTGNGRTGTLYAYQQFGVKPDLVTTAKGLGGGLPLGACLFGEKVQDVFQPGDHGSTYGGSPAACAGALSVLSRIDETLLADVRAKSAYLFETFTGAEGIESVSGLGLMIGLKTVKPAPEILAAARERGVLALTAKEKIRLLPALNIPRDQLQEAAGIIVDCCKL
ncbi:MAG: acetylornithine/succinylornithine family transaminase [Oscillospiraceae bacterium]|nr:acetylornithine/succinylornithine family transaminase [Oscillospiraceae bacterium]